MLAQIRPDLWETPAFSPLPGLTTHAYLWTPPNGRNVLFYSPGDEAEFGALEKLGGVAHQYLSHRDEAGPMLGRLADRFGTVLHAPARDLDGIEPHAVPDELFDERLTDANGVEVIPTPGHTAGSTSFVVTGVGGARYLFTGDTAFRGPDGRWRAGYLEAFSDAEQLRTSLTFLAEVGPDLVASSAFTGGHGVHHANASIWRLFIDEALASLPRPASAPAPPNP